MDVLLLLLTLAAVWRVARLVTIDFITEPLRRRAETRSPWLGYLMSCPWCISVWLAPLLVGPAVLWPDNRAVWVVMASLTASGVAGLMVAVEDRLDRR